ncbi:TPA: hypothetical protein JD053_19105 [Klebsiella michiganensis]|uniref:hypothetical protein n=1 Tax=Enterobacteriaceae TaxID=543 RepID=UPI000D1A29C4|nr:MULTISPECIES: hypothetical protein [Enterobacteriaceae]EKY3945843.1 hypothetical protein [Enterobacter hormaechei]HCL6052368.1 hypothetical protein [Raoultella ornithinolytica]HDU3837796.1 hypothetical protein [Klebsiella pneumoniae subsp. pneumoniae]HED2155667.1 hypothetical protein [Klebsiella variicola subsp. variicola]HEE9992385.1 hypothetical protein [Citrobacter braakii]
MLKTAAIALVCGFIGAALYGRFFPAQSPYDYIAVAKYTDKAGNLLPPAQLELVKRRADQMAESGYIIFNSSSMYAFPEGIAVPQSIVTDTK